ncbi:sugar kinase [Nonomuraea mangrovi]|uniref:Sugar kinase n=1 Tax=Nonomuraea mangrovi TaxID=2316207 RepID=A0ABW4T1R6_9ACTN
MTRPDVVGVGEAMVLLQPAEGENLATAERMDVHVGGAELNVCAAVARLGGSAWFASRVGADPFGERVKAAARSLGVGTTLVGRDDTRPTGVFFKDVLPDGARRVHYYRAGSAAAGMDEGDAAAILDAKPRAIVVSGITIALGEGPERLVRALAEGARSAGAQLVVDPNLRPALGRQDRVLATVLDLLPRTDLLVLGQDEAGPLFGVTEPADVFSAAGSGRSDGIEVVLKAGADGVFFHGEDDEPRHLPSAARAVRDPVGAGDALLGGYLAARLAGATRERAARVGSALAGRIVEVHGDVEGLPSAAEAAALLAG